MAKKDCDCGHCDPDGPTRASIKIPARLLGWWRAQTALMADHAAVAAAAGLVTVAPDRPTLVGRKMPLPVHSAVQA